MREEGIATFLLYNSKMGNVFIHTSSCKVKYKSLPSINQSIGAVRYRFLFDVTISSCILMDERILVDMSGI